MKRMKWVHLVPGDLFGMNVHMAYFIASFFLSFPLDMYEYTVFVFVKCYVSDVFLLKAKDGTKDIVLFSRLHIVRLLVLVKYFASYWFQRDTTNVVGVRRR